MVVGVPDADGGIATLAGLGGTFELLFVFLRNRAHFIEGKSNGLGGRKSQSCGNGMASMPCPGPSDTASPRDNSA